MPQRPNLRDRRVRFVLAATLAVATSATGLLGCYDAGGRAVKRFTPRVYPPPPAAPRVVALGNLRTAHHPSASQVRLSEFFFGEAPKPDLELVRPIDVAVAGQQVRICDIAFGAVFVWTPEHPALRDAPGIAAPAATIAVSPADPDGWLTVDVSRRVVELRGPDGQVRATCTRADHPFKPADALLVDHSIWVSNLAAHSVDIFDAATGQLRRSIGQRGRKPGQFGLPLGMARTPAGDVCVVDMLNNRVQVFGRDGTWKRNIGGPGDRVGQFGRPKDVAVGPDGIVFVTDASSQRVHVFAPDGDPLLAFGGPDRAPGSLEMPAGIAISPGPLPNAADLPGGFQPDYYVLVAEESAEPGIRVYAWRGKALPPRAPRTTRRADDPRLLAVNMAGTVNPHWRADQCSSCHAQAPGSIPHERVDAICLKCHDGTHASAESHPVGRPAKGPNLRLPAGWPLVDQRLSCLTCHDVLRHCDKSATRPADNISFLRGEPTTQPFAFCNRCHVGEPSWRINPHNNLDPAGAVNRDSCRFCHEASISDARDGLRHGQPHLRKEGQALCLACHVKHWDYLPAGHPGHELTDEIRDRLRAAGRADPTAALPLAGDRVTCYTCHNPHQRGLFPPDSPLGALADGSADRSVRLRRDFRRLCTVCHGL